MLDQTILYFAFFIFLTALNVIAYKYMPILGLGILGVFMVTIAASLTAFAGYEMFAVAFIFLNAIITVLAFRNA